MTDAGCLRGTETSPFSDAFVEGGGLQLAPFLQGDFSHSVWRIIYAVQRLLRRWSISKGPRDCLSEQMLCAEPFQMNADPRAFAEIIVNSRI